MKVMLKRDMFLGNTRYRQDNKGTEVPEYVDEREVVFWEKDKEYDFDKVVVLPHDAEPWSEEVKPPVQAVRRRVQNAGETKPVALSQLPGAKAPDPQHAPFGKSK